MGPPLIKTSDINTPGVFVHLATGKDCSMDAPQAQPPTVRELVTRNELALQTPYMAMSVQANQARRRYDICAGCCSWLTLAGYVVLPNTFTSLGNSSSLDGTAGGKAIQDAVRNVQLLPLAGVLCCLGTAGSCWLWWKWRKNYVWLISRIFL